MHAFYFGKSEQPLYGVSHSPSGSNYHDKAILICNSVGHEYIRSHRALQQLAEKLSSLGYYVLRFDYRGVGDSSGQFNEVSVTEWLANIKLAAEELKAISGQQRINVIGLRLGATLALMSSEQCNFNQVIMWDPVVFGQQYLENLQRLHKEFLTDRMWFFSDRSENDTLENEFLCYQYAQAVVNELKDINLLETNVADYQLLNSINTEQGNSIELDEVLKNKLNDYDTKYINEACNWNQLEYIDKALTAIKVIDDICGLVK